MSSSTTMPVLQRLDDPARLAALTNSGLVDDASDAGLQRISRIASSLLGVPTALVTLVDDRRQFFPGMVGLKGEYGETRETPLTHSFSRVVVEEGAPVVVPNARADSRFADNPAIDEMGVIAYCGVPLTTADGWRIGALCVIDHEVREWDDDDLALLQDLAELVHTEIRLRSYAGSLKDDRDAAHRRREQAEDVARLATRLAPILTAHDVMVEVGAHLDALGLADLASLGVMNATGDALDLVHGASIDAETAAAWETVDLDAQLPVTLAVRTARTVVVQSVDDAQQWPEMLEPITALGITSVGAFPFIDSTGNVFGALAVARTDDEPLSVDHLEQIAAVVGLALDRAWRHEREARQARVLQTALLPRRPDGGDDLDVVVRYDAASHELSVGGDWYDVVRLADRRYALVVGDIAGHDLEAARTVARARHAIGALAMAGLGPGDALHTAEAYITGRSRSMVTAAVAVLDAAAGTLTTASAGHPPPLIIRADGPVEFVPLEPGPPLMALNGPPQSAVTEVGPGDTLVLYTDGLVERRGESLDIGMERLATACCDAHQLTLDEVADEVVRLSVRDDDVALLLARVVAGAD